jgi:aldehyde:ferredoxin oxidoreductase
MHAWAGKILRVDLSEREYMIEDMDPYFAKTYMGAQGTATRILYDEVDPTIDGLDPENKLIFSTGTLVGTGAVTGIRSVWAAKSPLTGAIAFSNVGGYFPAEVKFAGYDMIIFEGQADEPVMLRIEDDEIEILDADHLWGKDVFETEDLIRSEIDDPWIEKETKIACIGPAGENLVKIAAIMSDRHRAAARCGIGAVMGSKNLKAVTVRGTGSLSIANPQGFNKTVEAALNNIKGSERASKTFPAYGSGGLVNFYNEIGLLPHYNFTKMALPEAHKISGQAVADNYLIRNQACFSCPMGCGGPAEVKEGTYAGMAHRPEYETHALMGPNCGIYDPEALLKGNNECNRLGIDTMDVSIAISCGMELFENGFLTEEDAGMKLNFGNGEAMVELIRQTAYREGLGDVIAEGGLALAEKYGHPEFFIGVKKMGYAGYDARNAYGMALGVVTSTRGGCHCRAYTLVREALAHAFGPKEMAVDPVTTKGKAEMLKMMQDMQTGLVDCAGFCQFSMSGQPPPLLFPQLATATGVNYTFPEIMFNGERIWNLQKLFNLKAGLTKKDDRLPKRLLEEPATAGPGKGMVPDMDTMLNYYYMQRGWDEEGVPTPQKLAELGILEE